MSSQNAKTVSEVTREVKDLLEANFPLVWVVGEISNCTQASSGHVYLTLKDDRAQLRAIIWRRTASRLKFELHDGLEVVAAGPLEIYAPRGSYQLIVESLMPRGIGALELAFRQLQQKLAAEGLFEPEHKRPLPLFPRRIALITSPTGAAVRDMLQVMTRRWQAADIVLLPVPVQGEGAAEKIAQALADVTKIPDVDVVVTGRGGGSLEDLWAFNEEVVARAIHECPIPVVSAVGHEIDVSISDLVADRRALTPSEAGELVVPQQSEVLGELRALEQQLVQGLRERAQRARLQLESLASRRIFVRPLDRIHEQLERLDDLELRLQRSGGRRVQSARDQLASISASLEALSPLNVLKRGYSITRRKGGQEIIRSAEELQAGEEIVTFLEQGSITSRVEETDAEATLFPPLSESDIE